jgi:peroxiredoxin
LQERLEEFTARGIRIVAVSVDPPEVAREHARKQGYTFTFLSDEKAEVIRRYDLLHENGKGEGMDISRPAEFLLDATGTVRWVNLTDNYRIRLQPDALFKVLDQLGLVWNLWRQLPSASAPE